MPPSNKKFAVSANAIIIIVVKHHQPCANQTSPSVDNETQPYENGDNTMTAKKDNNTIASTATG